MLLRLPLACSFVQHGLCAALVGLHTAKACIDPWLPDSCGARRIFRVFQTSVGTQPTMLDVGSDGAIWLIVANTSQYTASLAGVYRGYVVDLASPASPATPPQLQRTCGDVDGYCANAGCDAALTLCTACAAGAMLGGDGKVRPLLLLVLVLPQLLLLPQPLLLLVRIPALPSPSAAAAAAVPAHDLPGGGPNLPDLRPGHLVRPALPIAPSAEPLAAVPAASPAAEPAAPLAPASEPIPSIAAVAFPSTAASLSPTTAAEPASTVATTTCTT